MQRRSPASARDGEPVDGRNARGLENRRRIVVAMMELVGGGNYSPSAEEVATTANVGLRTVFRHFDDMDSLYREISTIKRDELQRVIATPLDGGDWRERLERLIERRTAAFEKMLPYKTAADLRRPMSSFLQTEHDGFVELQLKTILAVLPPAVAKDAVLVDALNLALSFESWRRLRTDQRLSIARARRILAHIVGALTADAPKRSAGRGPNKP